MAGSGGIVLPEPAIPHSEAGVSEVLNLTDSSGVEPLFVSVKDAARMLALSTWQMYQLLDDEARPIDSRYRGRRRLVSVESLKAYAASLPTERPEAS